MKKLSFLILFCFACNLSSPTEPAPPPPPVGLPPAESIQIPETLTESPITEPPPAPGPTPDLRVFTDHPSTFLLEEEDLNGLYYIPIEGDWEGFTTNQDMLDIRGVENGQAYIDATGRIGGLYRCFHRIHDRATVPLELCIYIVRFETAQGASLAMSSEWDSYRVGEETLFNDVPPIGDEYIALHYPPVTGDESMEYWLTFRVRNIFVDIMGYGLEENLDINMLVGVGRKVVENTLDGTLSE